MKKSAKKYFILYISLCFFTLSLITVMSGCAIQSMINAVNTVSQGGFKPPKWDLDMDVSVISKTMSLKDLLDPDTAFGSMFASMSADSSFDKVTAADLQEGGKYYYPDVNNFGLREGDFVINYPIPFPGTQNMLNGQLSNEMIEQFTDKIVYNLSSLPAWPLPTTVPVTITKDSPTPGGIGTGTGNMFSVDIDLTIDINGDGTKDVTLKGIESSAARMSLNFTIEKYNNSTNAVVSTFAPTLSQIEMSSVTIENITYLFEEGVRTESGDNIGLRFKAKDFITNSDGDHTLWFNGTGSDANDYSTLDVDGFSFTLKGDSAAALASNSPGYSYRLNIKVDMSFGENYNIVCALGEMVFDLGTTATDLSMLDVFESTDDMDNLASYFISNLSFKNAGIYLTAESTLPMDINLSPLFDDDTGDITISPPAIPSMPQNDGEGAIISYFSKNDPNNEPDDYVLLQFEGTNLNELATIQKIDRTSDAASKTKLALYRSNSNFDDFIEWEDPNEHKFRRPRSMHFCNYFATLANPDTHIGVRDSLGGLSIQAGLILPISISVLSDKDPMDLMGAFGMAESIQELSGLLSSGSEVPISDLKNIGFRITCDNYLPLGVGMQFMITNDLSADNLQEVISLVENDTAVLDHGDLIQFTDTNGHKTDDYYISSSQQTAFVAAIGDHFKYKTVRLDNPSEDVSTDLVYDGSFGDYLKSRKNLKIAVKLKILESETDDNGEHIAVRLREDNSLTLKVDIIGSATLDLSSFVKL